MPFNHFNGGSSPLGLNKRIYVNGKPNAFQAFYVGSNPTIRNFFYEVSEKGVSFLIGKELSCQESLCRFEPDLARLYINSPKLFIGKVAIGKVRYLLNIVRLNLSVRFTPFPYIYIMLIILTDIHKYKYRLNDDLIFRVIFKCKAVKYIKNKKIESKLR